MKDSPLPIDVRATVLMMVMCLIMALGQITLKYTATNMTPTLQIALRSGGAVILIYLLMYWRKQPVFTVVGAWKPGVIVGILFASEFFLVGEALRYTSATHMSIFLYTAPIFAALGLHFFIPAERLKPIQWLGIIVAFTGIGMSFLGRDSGQNTIESPNLILGDLLAIGAGFFWAVATLIVRTTRLKKATATETLFYQLVATFLILGLGAIMMTQTTVTFSWALVGSLFFQTVILSCGALLLWFWLLRKYLASRLGALTFMTPLFGVTLGVLLLDETVDRSFFLGAVGVLVGLYLVNKKE